MVKQPYIMPLKSGGGGEAVWGQITGTISNQEDLQNALNNATELYRCTYNTTTVAQIATALTQNKLPVVEYDNKLYVFSYSDAENQRYVFANVTDNVLGTVWIGNLDVWNNSNVNAESTGNKVNSISSSSTNTQYAGAKAVYDYSVAKNQGSGNAGKFLVVGNDGNVTTVTMSQWSGGNY